MVDGVVWPDRTLTQLEGEDWGEPEWQSYVVTNSHHLRHKPLRGFTAEDLRFMLGQQISLPVLMPMALDVLEMVDPFAGGENGSRGSLLGNALAVDKGFWTGHPELWYRMSAVLVELHSFREYIERELLPAARGFETARPHVVPGA